MIIESLFTVISTIVFGLFVYYIYYTTKNRSEYIKADKCNQNQGEFAVQAGYNSGSIKKNCSQGTSGNSGGISECTFSVNSLSDAILKCNENFDNCTKFVYNSRTGVMSFLNDRYTTSPSETHNIYLRQYSVRQS